MSSWRLLVFVMHVPSIVLLCTFAGCLGDLQAPPPPPSPPAPDIRIVSVEPNRGYAGTLVKIIVHREVDSIGLSGVYTINGYPQFVSKHVDDSLWIRFPYVLPLKEMNIHAYNYAQSSQCTVKVDFVPYIEHYSRPFPVVWWNNDDTIDQWMSPHKWVGRNLGDTLALDVTDIGPDWAIYHRLRFLNHGKDQLPAFLSYIIYGSYGAPLNDTLPAGLIKIDHWDPHGIVSGGVFSFAEEDPFWQFRTSYFYAILPKE